MLSAQQQQRQQHAAVAGAPRFIELSGRDVAKKTATEELMDEPIVAAPVASASQLRRGNIGFLVKEAQWRSAENEQRRKEALRIKKETAARYGW
mmetsp:Transcript_30612/g.74734  ORF Transcript_30612/g.74734 Transcript_30612/m.74734 type:complete len:94 (+) Transcript_30612:1-282(+)